MTESVTGVPDTTDASSVIGPGMGRAGLAGAALAVGALTILARVVGFGRWVVFARTVHGGCLADVYNTANLLPNVLFEVAAGGALAGAIVPVLAPAIARGDRAAVHRTVSALLTWSLVLLLPLGLAGALLARPVMRAFLGDGRCPAAAVDVGTRMLLIFLPQLFCYAIAVVLAGVLQAHRRFLAAALAPLASSVVVIGSYLLFAHLAHGDTAVDSVPGSARTALALGTTLGVAALALTVLVPMAAVGWRPRPVLMFPPGAARQARALAGAGVAALVAQQGTLLLVAWLSDRHGTPGSVTAYTWAGAVFLVPYAVLAVPLATSAFPRIAAAAAAGDDRAAARLTAATARGVLAASCLGAAVLVAAAGPVSRVFAAGGVADAGQVAAGITALAPGLVGYGLAAHLSRVLYAAHAGRRAATAIVIGWAVAAGFDVLVVPVLSARHAVAALCAGASVGMSLSGVLLLIAVRRVNDAGGLAALGRTGPVTLAAAALTAGGGRWLAERLGATDTLGACLASVAVGAAVTLGYVVAVASADRSCLSGLDLPRLLRPSGPRT